MLESQRLDVVMPVIARDFDRFVLFMATYRKFWHVPGTLHLFVRDDEFGLFAPFAGDTVNVRRKRDVIGTWPYRTDVKGWIRQQMVKLAAAACVSTPVYMTIDADCMIARPLQYSDLIVDGRAPWDARTSDRLRAYGSMCDALGISPTNRPAVPVSWRPPCFMHGPSVLWALARLSRDESWLQVFAHGCATARWSEVMLAHIAATARGIWDTHFRSASITHDPLPYEGDFARNFEAWDPCVSFSGSYDFVVLQGFAQIPVSRVREKLLDRVPGVV